MQRMQITLNDEQYDYMKKDMQDKGIKNYTVYFQKMLDQQMRVKKEGIDHILFNTRETNKIVKTMLECINHTLRTNEQPYIPTSVSKADVLKEAELSVKNDFAKLREIKLNNSKQKSIF
jgi:hypothetical protein